METFHESKNIIKKKTKKGKNRKNVEPILTICSSSEILDAQSHQNENLKWITNKFGIPELNKINDDITRIQQENENLEQKNEDIELSEISEEKIKVNPQTIEDAGSSYCVLELPTKVEKLNSDSDCDCDAGSRDEEVNRKNEKENKIKVKCPMEYGEPKEELTTPVVTEQDKTSNQVNPDQINQSQEDQSYRIKEINDEPTKPTETHQEVTKDSKYDLDSIHDMNIPSWDNLHQFQNSLDLPQIDEEPLETFSGLSISGSSIKPTDTHHSSSIPIPIHPIELPSSTISTWPTSNSNLAQSYQLERPYIPSDPPSAQARRKLLTEPELKEFLSVPPFETQFKSRYKFNTSFNKRKGRLVSNNCREQISLNVTWKELSEELGFECLDTDKDETIAFYTMILWDDLLPPRPTSPTPIKVNPMNSASKSHTESSAKQIVKDFFGEMTDVIESAPSAPATSDHDNGQRRRHHHHYSGCQSVGQGCIYHADNSHYVYGNRGNFYQCHQPGKKYRNISTHDPMFCDPYQQHDSKLASYNYKTNHHHHHQIEYNGPSTPKLSNIKKSLGFIPAYPPSQITNTSTSPLSSMSPKVDGVGGKTKKILLKASVAFRSAFRGKDKQKESKAEGLKRVEQTMDQSFIKEETGAINSTEQLLINQAIILSQQEADHQVRDDNKYKVIDSNCSNSNSSNRIVGSIIKARGIFSLRKNRKSKNPI